MATLEILQYPDSRLRRRAEPVAPDAIDDDVRALVTNMLETMYAAPGIGLAATQVNDGRRVVVIDVSERADDPLALINPEIVELGGAIEDTKEGCLSVPDIFAEVARHSWARVKALNPQGKPFEFEAQGLLAVCVQHEIDHLDGKLFIDYLSELKRKRLRKRAEKEQRQRARDNTSSPVASQTPL